MHTDGPVAVILEETALMLFGVVDENGCFVFGDVIVDAAGGELESEGC